MSKRAFVAASLLAAGAVYAFSPNGEKTNPNDAALEAAFSRVQAHLIGEGIARAALTDMVTIFPGDEVACGSSQVTTENTLSLLTFCSLDNTIIVNAPVYDKTIAAVGRYGATAADFRRVTVAHEFGHLSDADPGTVSKSQELNADCQAGRVVAALWPESSHTASNVYFATSTSPTHGTPEERITAFLAGSTGQACPPNS